MILFIAVLSILIIQRMIELKISSRNFAIMMNEGGIEYGRAHYKYIVMLHTLFIVSMAVEYFVRDHYDKLSDISYLFLVLFALLLIIRFWVISSLGKYWNTRIVRVPGSKLIRSGPYKLLKHPNYMVVALEVFCLPMIFGLVYTAIVFTILNSLMLFVRIKEENKVLTN